MDETDETGGWSRTYLGHLLQEVDVRVRDISTVDRDQFVVLSLTKQYGLIPQCERFEKRIATEDVSNYKVVYPEWIVYNPYVIWEGAIHALRRDAPGIVSPVYKTLRRSQNDGGFLDLMLRTPRLIDSYNRLCSGAVNRRRSIRLSAFQSIEVTVPPLAEQRAIAHVLRTVKQAKEASEKVIAATRQLKASLMHHLFTYGLVLDGDTGHVALRETDYGSLPESWDVVQLGSLISEGPQNGLYKHASCYGDGTPILRIDAFSDGEKMERQQLKRLRLSPEGIETYALRENDIVINRVNGSVDILAKAAYVGKLPEPTVFESNMMRFAVDTKATTTRYIICYLLSRFAKKQIREKARIIHQASINQQDIKSLLVPLPHLEIQIQIAHCIDVVERRIEAEGARASVLATLFSSLLHHLMTGKLRVRDLDPIDHSHDGPAAG